MGAGRAGRLVLVGGLVLAVPVIAFAAGLPLEAGGVRVTKTVRRSFQDLRQGQVIRQRWDLSCGSAALSTLLTYHYGDPTPETAVIVAILRRTDPVRVRARGGFSLLDLKRFVEARGYEGKGYADLTLDDLVGLGAPAIVPVRLKGYDHFVVFRGIRGDRVLLADPAYGNVTMQTGRFVEIWKNGIGFIALRRGASPAHPGLLPRVEEFLVPDGTVVARALRGGGPAGPTRRGP